MKFLIDGQLPPAWRGRLLERGHREVQVFEISMVAASDAEIAARGGGRRSAVSKNEDS